MKFLKKNSALSKEEQSDRRTEAAMTKDFNLGDVYKVIYKDDVVAVVQVTGKIRDYSVEVNNTGAKGKITFLPGGQINYHEKTGPNRELYLKRVKLQKIRTF